MCTRYQAYEVKDQNKIVDSTRTICYQDEHEGLYMIKDTHLLGYSWDEIWSFENDSDNDYSRVVTTTTCSRVKQGTQFDTNFKVSAGFNGLGLSLSTECGPESKTFSESETTKTETTEDTCTVKANTSVFLYQKVYHFRTDIWFRLDSFAQMWTVGNYKRPGVALVSSDVDIHANSFFQHDKSLVGKGDLDATTTRSVDEKTNIKPFEKCSDRCRDYLHERGV
ncbi:hypothetical protein AFLA70_4g008970 [Aspergillus flavus AF70]|nr:hypothetical protein AFLA70_4g008970 [Aspergillus flavus AF70]